jgi:Holliday junction resolvase-like predicted endonuclease
MEREVVISILKTTSEGVASPKSLSRDARGATSVVLKQLKILQAEGLVDLQKDLVYVDNFQRLALATKAISLGADVERISTLLHWQEFESLSAIALQKNNYAVRKNVHFKSDGKKWEIDVVGCKKPIVLCVDCKHWHHTVSSSVLRKIVEAQTERTQALAKTIPNTKLQLECTKWDRAKFVPAILSLISGSSKFCNEVPIIPVLQLQDFVTQLPAQLTSIKHFTKNFTHLT